MKIAIIGSHGTGKTTLAYGLTAALKRKYKSVTLVPEAASTCPLVINEHASMESQSWILSKQLCNEIEAQDKYDVVICDRSVIDSYAYSLSLGAREKVLVPLWMRQVVYDWYITYDLIFKTTPNEKYLVHDGIRSITSGWQKEIDLIISSVLSDMGILDRVYDVSMEDSLDYIIDTVLLYDDKYNKLYSH